MRLKFDLNNNVEKPEIVLGKRNYDKFGSIVNFDNLTYDYNLMLADSISFTVYKELNNEKERLWDEIKERRLIWLKEFNEWFQIDVVTNDENGITKEVTGTSLCEAELGQILLKSTEINTEDDIARETYINPTVFYKPSNPNESLLHRLLKEVPNYSIKHVDESLWNIQRTFSIDGTSIYDELTGEIAEEIGCLFLFDSTDRSISVYDLKTNCNHCGYRGDYTDICPECGSTDLDYGYGNDTTIFVDSETLAESISLSGKQDEVKNYIKVSGGDDIINAAIAACNPTGTQYIYAFSDRDKEDMSDALIEKIDKYAIEYDALTPTYQSVMKNVYDAIDEQLKLESTMMPDIETAPTNAQKELAKLTSANLSPIAVQDVSIASVYTVNNAVLGMAKCIVNSTVFKIEIINSSFASQTWKGKFRVTNYSDEEDTAENTGYITVTINDDYAYYVEQRIKKTIDRDDVYLVDMFDTETSLSAFKTELKKYCLSRLNSFESAYQTIIDTLIELNCGNDSTYGDIYNDLYMPYYNKLISIQEEIKIRASEIEAVDARLAELEKSRNEITTQLNLKNYLGDELWKELCSFRREDSYENSNYISDGLDNSEILAKAQELFNKAKSEAITASTLQMSLSTTMFNLLAIPEFKKLTGMFEGGNWIRVGLDDKIYRLRLIHYKIDFSQIQNIDVEFSDVTQTANGLNDVESLMNKVTSMATNFSYVAHQAEQGSKSFTELDKIRNDGLNTGLYNISNSVNQDFIVDEHGITGRQWDDILGDYLPEQTKWINNCLAYTNDYWKSTKEIVGKIEYYNPILKTTISQYGVICEAVISGILMGNDIIGGAIYSENYSSTAGTYINLKNGDFTFAGGKLTYDSEKDTLNLTGTITFEGIDYSSPESKKALQDSLGITDVQNDIDEFNNASILTPLEKQNMLDDWNAIQSEYAKNIELAKAFELYTDDSDDSNDNKTVISYINAYRTLATQITKCGLDNLATSTNINTRIYTDINNYYAANVDFANLIDQEAKRLSEQALTDAKAYSDSLKKDVDKDISDVNALISDTQTYIDGAFKDKVIDESESASISQLLYRLNTEKSDIDSRYTSIYNNTSISTSSKNNLKSAKDAYNTSHTNLISLINTAVSVVKDTTKTEAQKQTAIDNMNNAFSDYDSKISALSSAFESAIDSISTNKLDNFVNGDYKTFVSDIQTQVDGKSETYYQSTQPYENHLNVANNSNYNKLVGDLWYDSDETSKKTYVYTKIANGSNYDYKWMEMEVPVEIFDMADGKAQIFTSKPSNYNKNDLWLVGSDYVPTISGVKTGYVLVSLNDNIGYTESDWVLSIEYTDDTVANSALSVATQAVSDSVLTPSEKRDLLNEINNIKSNFSKYIAICSAMSISYTDYLMAYSFLTDNMLGSSSVYQLDVSENTTLTSTQVTDFKNYFSDYYTEEANIIQSIQNTTNNNVSNAQDAADKAQADATEALGLLADIASDNKITPVEKLQLEEKYNTIKASHEALVSKYGTDYAEDDTYKSYLSAYNDLYEMLYGSVHRPSILDNMSSTYEFGENSNYGNYTKDNYSSIISNYYSYYQLFVNKVTSNLEEEISSVKSLAEEAQTLGGELKKCLGFSTEISSDYVISPYIGGGYSNITGTNGSVIIDPSLISNSEYIFNIKNLSGELVMGVDTSGNGIFKGNITTNAGTIGGWDITSGAICKDAGDYRVHIRVPQSNETWVFSTQTKSDDGNYYGQTFIRADGYFYSRNANISGTITATSGSFGAWVIGGQRLYSDSASSDARYRAYIQQPTEGETWCFSTQYSDGTGFYGTSYIKANGEASFSNIKSTGYISTNNYISTNSYINAVGTIEVFTNGNASNLILHNDYDRKAYIRIDGDEYLWLVPHTSSGFESSKGAYLDLATGAFSVASLTNRSSKRYKENIQPIDEIVADKLLNINVYSFDYKPEYGEKGMYGVIAEEIDKIYPIAVTYNRDKQPDAVDYTRFIPLLIKKIQMLETEIQHLKELIQ